jgi:hypothetical protein
LSCHAPMHGLVDAVSHLRHMIEGMQHQHAAEIEALKRVSNKSRNGAVQHEIYSNNTAPSSHPLTVGLLTVASGRGLINQVVVSDSPQGDAACVRTTTAATAAAATSGTPCY